MGGLGLGQRRLQRGPTYLTSDGVFTDSGTASTWLSNGMTIAGLFIALLAPITGQRADRRGRGGVWLGWFTGAVVACMLAMYFVHPESVLGPKGALMLGIALLGLGNVFFEFASVNYNAMLNHLGEKEDRGKISGFGWASGYIGSSTWASSAPICSASPRTSTCRSASPW